MTEFITRNYGQKEFEVIIKTDNKEHYKATEDFARKLIDHAKPQTNADRIRAMSDEELAIHLHDLGWDCHLCAEHRRLDNEPLLRGEKCDEKCMEHCLEWLQQPADMRGEGE